MRILIVGFGSIGRRHYENLLCFDPDIEITIWRQHATATPDNLDVRHRVVYSLDDALRFKPNCALICNPASQHIQTALILAQEGIHLFIEKPISNTLKNVDSLLRLGKQKCLTLMVGYNFRFYKPLQIMRSAVLEGKIGRVLSVRAEIGQYLPDWRPNVDYRESVSAQKDLGGGALLELSHELDYVRWIIGDVARVFARAEKLSDLEMDVEDLAEMVLEFQNGVLGSVHLDMVQRAATRICRIVGTEGTVEWQGNNNQVKLFSSMDNAWQDLHPATKIDRNEMYKEELQHFLNCVKDGEKPKCDGNDGLLALRLAIAAKKSSDQLCFMAL